MAGCGVGFVDAHSLMPAGLETKVLLIRALSPQFSPWALQPPWAASNFLKDFLLTNNYTVL